RSPAPLLQSVLIRPGRKPLRQRRLHSRASQAEGRVRTRDCVGDREQRRDLRQHQGVFRDGAIVAIRSRRKGDGTDVFRSVLSRSRRGAGMSTAEKTVLTPDDLPMMPDGDRYELVNGELVDTPVSEESNLIAGWITH